MVEATFKVSLSPESKKELEVFINTLAIEVDRGERVDRQLGSTIEAGSELFAQLHIQVIECRRLEESLAGPFSGEPVLNEGRSEVPPITNTEIGQAVLESIKVNDLVDVDKTNYGIVWSDQAAVYIGAAVRTMLIKRGGL